MRAENSKRLFNPYPLAIAAACVACGVLVAHSSSPPLIVCVIVGLLTLMAAIICFRRGSFTLAALCLALSLVGAGASLLTIEEGKASQEIG